MYVFHTLPLPTCFVLVLQLEFRRSTMEAFTLIGTNKDALNAQSMYAQYTRFMLINTARRVTPRVTSRYATESQLIWYLFGSVAALYVHVSMEKLVTIIIHHRMVKYPEKTFLDLKIPPN